MRVCVYGAGAIGGHLAARLIARGEHDVSVVARGAHLAAIRESGLKVQSGGETLGGRPAAATDDPATLPPQDVVFVTLKASSTPALAPSIAQLLAPDGVAVFIANGIPWWWRQGSQHPGPLEPVDPGGVLWSTLGPQRTLGGVVYSGNEVIEPGVIHHRGSNKWPVGEPDGTVSERAQAIAAMMAAAGCNSTAVPDIHHEVLRKLIRNICGNPVSALTRLPEGIGAPVEGLSAVGRAMMEELLAVGVALGVDIRGDVDVDALVKPEGRPGGKSSMLQDVEAGRPMEVEPILGQVAALGKETGVPTPTLDVVAALLRGLDLSIRRAREG